MENYGSLTDKELIVLLRAGDRGAFTQVYNRYWSSMYAHVYKMLRNREEAMDLVQDLFSALWLKSSELNPETKLSGHLYLSARNRVFNLIRQNRVKNDYLGAVIKFAEESGTEMMEQLDEKDLMEAIEAEIRNLPEKMREVFELSRKHNLSHKEIAQQLGISDQTVRKQVQNALRILKPRLQSLGIGMFVLFYLR